MSLIIVTLSTITRATQNIYQTLFFKAFKGHNIFEISHSMALELPLLSSLLENAKFKMAAIQILEHKTLINFVYIYDTKLILIMFTPRFLISGNWELCKKKISKKSAIPRWLPHWITMSPKVVILSTVTQSVLSSRNQ